MGNGVGRIKGVNGVGSNGVRGWVMGWGGLRGRIRDGGVKGR